MNNASIDGALGCLGISIVYIMGFWAILLSVQAIIKREYRIPTSGEVITGSRAVRAGLIRLILFSAVMIILAISILNS